MKMISVGIVGLILMELILRSMSISLFDTFGDAKAVVIVAGYYCVGFLTGRTRN